MPKLSLYRPEKGKDFKFIDRAINERFQVGGVDVFVHKYLGPVDPAEGEATPTTPTNSNTIGELGIQDILFMETRDRNYAPDVYVLRGIYTMQDLDFNLSQFGLFLQNDTIMMYFHLGTTVDALLRKVMPGDVFELPHLKDEYALDDKLVALKRFYVVQDVSRPTSGFSQTWYPHLLKAKCVPLVDSQEYKQILDQDSGNGDNSSLRDLLSTYNKSIEINDQIIEQAMIDAPVSGYNTRSFYVIPTRENGMIDVADTSDIWSDASIDQSILDASAVLHSPNQTLYLGYNTGNGIPPNGAPFIQGIEFPNAPAQGAFCLRTDYIPNNLYRYNGKHWALYSTGVQMTLNEFGYNDVAPGQHFAGQDVRLTQKTSFINNNSTATIQGKIIPERQALSKALKPKADN